MIALCETREKYCTTGVLYEGHHESCIMRPSSLFRGVMTDIYKTFDHTADVGIEVYGENLHQLYSNAGYALFDLITFIDTIEATTSLSVTVEGTDQEDLMVRWLSELLYVHQMRGYLLCDFTLHELGEKILRATVRGEQYASHRHELLKEIKAVTYHQLMVGKEKDRWVARIVFDV